MKKSFIKIMALVAMISVFITGCAIAPTREEAAEGSTGDESVVEEDTESTEESGDYEDTLDKNLEKAWNNIEEDYNKEYNTLTDLVREINPDYDYPEEYEIGYDFYLDAAWNRLTLGDDGSICDTAGNPVSNYSGLVFTDTTTLMIGDVYIPGYYADESSRIIKIIDEYAAASIYYVSGDMFTNLLNNMVNFPEELDQSYASIMAQCLYSYPDEGGFALVDDYGNTLIASGNEVPEEGDWVIVVGVLNTLEDPQYIDVYSMTVQPSL